MEKFIYNQTLKNSGKSDFLWRMAILPCFTDRFLVMNCFSMGKALIFTQKETVCSRKIVFFTKMNRFSWKWAHSAWKWAYLHAKKANFHAHYDNYTRKGVVCMKNGSFSCKRPIFRKKKSCFHEKISFFRRNDIDLLWIEIFTNKTEMFP